ncbi:DUF2019 domain-containing protein [Aquabacter cavernae]|uniref:DUF2019 domain-containing protein n=1 Tax=Aquabacter cavernae TaxID=2496029 RepID=UPI000F8CB2E7|nr:DUF2019 domain-containing protein [Aquabacter cavernae]
MKRKLAQLTDTALRDLFEALCIERGQKWNPENVRPYNKLYLEIVDVAEELKRRPGDARHLLIPLLKHEDWHVRLKAGTNTYALTPQEAREALQWLRETRLEPFGAEAGMFLSGIDRGEFTPR